MAMSDKVVLLNEINDTLKSRMFANLLEEAVDKIRDTLSDYDVKRIASESIESDDALNMFIDFKRSNGLSENTLLRYAYVIGQFMKHANVKTADVTEYHVKEYFSEELSRGIAKSTIEGLREILNAYYNWLVREGLVRKNPLSNIDTIKTDKKVKKAFSETDIARMRRSCESVRDTAIIEMLLSTGCRISEIIQLNRDDVKLETGECIVHGKGSKDRVVFINDVATMCLKEYLATRDDDNPALFINYRKKRLMEEGVRKFMHILSEKSGVENIHPHRFRRTSITMLLNRGMPIQEVAVISGHDSIDTTMMYYDSSKARIKNSWQRYSL